MIYEPTAKYIAEDQDGKLDELPVYTLEIPMDTVVVFQADTNRYTVEDVKKMLDDLSAAFAGQMVIFLPDDMSIATATLDELKTLRDTIDAVIREESVQNDQKDGTA